MSESHPDETKPLQFYDDEACVCCHSFENLLHASWPDIFPCLEPIHVCQECKDDGSLQKWLMQQIMRDNPELNIP